MERRSACRRRGISSKHTAISTKSHACQCAGAMSRIRSCTATTGGLSTSGTSIRCCGAGGVILCTWTPKRAHSRTSAATNGSVSWSFLMPARSRTRWRLAVRNLACSPGVVRWSHCGARAGYCSIIIAGSARDSSARSRWGHLMNGKSTILIVDDQKVMRETIGMFLSGDEYELEFAGDGPTALRKAAATIPDLILLDIMMPGMDGYEVCRRLRGDNVLAEVPIVM